MIDLAKYWVIMDSAAHIAGNRFPTKDAALKEAAGLAMENDRTYVVLEAVVACKKTEHPIEWAVLAPPPA